MMSGDAKWYVVRTHFGKEFSAKKVIDKRVEQEDFTDVKEVVVPVYKETVYKDGKKREVERKSFPGYIYIHMNLATEKKTSQDGTETIELSEDGKKAMAFVKECPYISGFVYQQGSLPRSLSSVEIESMSMSESEEAIKMITPLQVDFDIGQKVLIIDGPFNNFSGTIKEIYSDKKKVCVNISIFGRTTPVEIDYFKVKKN